MSINKPHPERFEEYNLLPDGKSFTIKGCKFIFKIDRYGGWRDEYGNYYNANGDPDFQPQDADLTPQECSSQQDEIDEDYDRLYGGNISEDDQEDDQEDTKTLQKIAKNLQILSTYPLGKNLRVFFRNMPYKTAPKQVYELYSGKIKGILNIVFNIVNNKRNGQGHFVMEDGQAAEKLIKLQGEKITERQVYFEVQKLEQLIMDPLKQSELKPFWNPTSKVPKFYNSALVKQEQRPQYIKQQKAETKKANKKEEKKIQQKKITKQKSEFTKYILNFEIFDTKTKFVNWMTSQKAQRDVDYKNIQKQTKGDKIIITMDVRTSFAESCKGKKYNGKDVQFTPISQ